MYNENDIINKLRELLERQPAAFQKGRALNGGVGKQITVNINGKKIKALSYNVISPNEVTVFYDSTHDRYIAWQQPNRVLRSDKLIYRRTKPTPVKRTFGKYLFKVFTRVVNSLLKVQGFGSDVEIENSDGYELVGLTNTGDGYVAIAKSGNTYLFDVDGEQVTKTLIPIDFGLSYIPYLGWYGGKNLTGQDNVYSEESLHTYTPSNTNQNVYWSNFFSLTLFNRQIPNYVAQLGVSKNTTETWTKTLPNETPNDCNIDFSYTYNHYSSGQPTSYTVTLDYEDVEDTKIYYFKLNNLNLNSQSYKVQTVKTATATNSNIYNPTNGQSTLVTFTTSQTILEKDVTIGEQNVLWYADVSHPLTKEYSRVVSLDTENINYSYYANQATYRYSFTFNYYLGEGAPDPDNMTSGPMYTQTYAMDYAETATYGQPTPTANCTIETRISPTEAQGIGRMYGLTYDYRFKDPNGNVISNFAPDFLRIETEHGQFAFVQGTTQFRSNALVINVPYPYATPPVINTPSLLSTSFVPVTPTGQTKRSYNYDKVYTIADKETDTTLLYESEIYKIYYFDFKDLQFITTDFYQYNEVYVSDAGNYSTNIIRDNTRVYVENYNAHPTISLIVRLNTTTYEIKDFNINNGFNFNNRFYAFTQTSVVEPTLGVNVFTCTVLIGLHSNNKGNYQNIIKQNKSTTINNGTPLYERTYHSVVAFNLVGLNINLYWISSGVIKKYTGTITNASYTTSTNSTTNETTRNYTGLTVNLVEKEDIDFICHCNNYENGIFITASNDYTRFLLEYLTGDIRQVNCYEEDDKMRIAIAKIPQQTDTTAYADIYEFDTINKKFIRIGNDSSDLSTIDDTSNYISYHP